MDDKNNLKLCSQSSSSLREYLIEKAKQHNNYKIYSTIDRIVDIRDNHCLYLGDASGWNDITDRNDFSSKKHGKIYFGKCFSYAKDENVAMWMLYGGINKCAGMIDFTRKGMRSILDIDHIELSYYDKETKETTPIKNLPRSSFEIFLIDILYYSQCKNEKYVITHSDERAYNVSKEVVESLSGYKKVFSWQHEKECRLIVSIDESLLPSKCNTVKIDLHHIDLGKSFERIYHGPNYPLTDIKNTLPSKLDSTIDWELCDKRHKCCCNKKNKCSSDTLTCVVKSKKT